MIQPSEAFAKLNEYLITERDKAKSTDVSDALQKVRDYMTGLIQDRAQGSYNDGSNPVSWEEVEENYKYLPQGAHNLSEAEIKAKLAERIKSLGVTEEEYRVRSIRAKAFFQLAKSRVN